ncbi:hypothetical protein K443DRAFT_394657 [Laccaria amethystina LaAM-08-1]|uniref:Unplaced genomic scaffold K443scaffold_30, whole genome shotgun sequence n=1 Tax=Laccaria amethystina LaAM-08-1 TaxID=1095629 RepID=A0A0C9Y463_9AGAR|nr:hypothetical protein K443DRAFT_394657 [Laccaria amethystina LaAM-08-1]
MISWEVRDTPISASCSKIVLTAHSYETLVAGESVVPTSSKSIPLTTFSSSRNISSTILQSNALQFQPPQPRPSYFLGLPPHPRRPHLHSTRPFQCTKNCL